MGDRVSALGEIVADVLRRMLRELLARKPGGHLVESELEGLELRLPLPSREDPRVYAERVVAGLERLIDGAVERAAAFRPGHTFCYRCQAAVCEHSSPPSSRHVFAGYGPTGTPRWQDFAQLCLERRHPQIDLLYEDRPVLLTVQQTGAELREGLLDAFRSGESELMGQVIAGFYVVPGGGGRSVLALSFQVAASRSRGGRTRLGLNILARAPGSTDLAEPWERRGEPPWARPVRWAQTALRTVRVRGRGSAAVSVEQRVERILRGLARRLEHELRSRDRRTRHAEDRHVSGVRPTRKAVDDAREAGAEDVMVDARSGAMVVLGERGRTHFFTSDGRLVSSVRYSRDAIERKRKLGLWRNATAGEVEKLRGEVADRAPRG